MEGKEAPEDNNQTEQVSAVTPDDTVVPSWMIWAGVSMFAFASMGGVGLGVALSTDKDEKKKPKEPLSQHMRARIGLTAFKALGYGTALCLSVGGLVTFAAAAYLDAWTPRALTAAIRERVSRTSLGKALKERTDETRKELEERLSQLPSEEREEVLRKSLAVLKRLSNNPTDNKGEKEEDS